MPKSISAPILILNVSETDIIEGDAKYYSIEDFDQVIFSIDITGIVTVTLDFDINGDGSVIVQEEFTSDDQKVFDDPCGKVRAWTSGCGGGESAKVYMRKVMNV